MATVALRLLHVAHKSHGGTALPDERHSCTGLFQVCAPARATRLQPRPSPPQMTPIPALYERLLCSGVVLIMSENAAPQNLRAGEDRVRGWRRIGKSRKTNVPHSSNHSSSWRRKSRWPWAGGCTARLTSVVPWRAFMMGVCASDFR